MTNNQIEHEKVISRYIKSPPSALYDIGVGPKTEWKTLGELYPELKIFGVEANPDMCENIHKSGFTGMLINYAIYDQPGTLDLFVYREDGLDASLLKIKDRPVSKKYCVDCITLDAADEMFSKQKEIILWMDIEGAELAALRSGEKLLRSKRVRWINLEARENPPWEKGCKGSDIENYLLGLGYKKIIEYNKHPKVGHCDIIYVLE